MCSALRQAFIERTSMRLEALVAYRARMSAYGSGCVETVAVCLCDAPVGFVDLSRRDLRFWRFAPLVRVFRPDLAVPCGYLAGYGLKMKPTSAYAALIAAISGRMPMMLMTRLRL